MKTSARASTSDAKLTAKASPPTLPPADQLKALEPDFKKVEALIRKLQAKAAAINTDAAYEIKRAADYFLLDAKAGTEIVVKQMAEPDYQPDAEFAAIIKGEKPDAPPIPFEQMYAPQPKPKKARGERRLKEVETEVVVAGAPIAPRSRVENA